MSSKINPVKKRRSELDYLRDIRASVRRLEAGQKRLEKWSNFHKGEHKSTARAASFVATLVSSVIIAAVEFFRK